MNSNHENLQLRSKVASYTSLLTPQRAGCPLLVRNACKIIHLFYYYNLQFNTLLSYNYFLFLVEWPQRL